MPASGNSTRNLFKNASWLFSGSMAASLFSAAEPILIARFLGVEQLGLFTLIIAYVGIINGLIDLRSPDAVVKYVGQYRELGEKNKVLSFIKFFYVLDFLVGIAALGVCLILAGVADDLFIHSENTFKFTLIYSASILVSSVNKSSEAVLRVFDRFKTIAFVRTSRTGLRVVLIAVSLLAGFGIEGVFVCYVVAAFVFFLMLQIEVLRVLRQSGLKRWTTAKVKNLEVTFEEVRSFVLVSTFTGFLSNAFSRQIPVLILGYFTAKEAVGLYRVAIIFSGVSVKLRKPVQDTIYPALVAAQSRGSKEVFSDIVSYSTKNLLKVFLPVGLIFFLFANKIIIIFFGSAYEPATLAMQLIVISEILFALCFWIDSAELAHNRLRQRVIRVALSSMSYVAVLLVLVQAYSYNGAAASRLVPAILIFVFSLFTFNKIRYRTNHSILQKPQDPMK
ncbi:MAG: oligosaccharide flippase family protein [Candidatus Dadabacteria bacterium]|nr:oligosaccharide flippase family protein [Candidatus Dadabacteria bacterium]MDE0663945.1 oligosaccharide flippase family protein [Candidatus Dadabacteria bacterium]